MKKLLALLLALIMVLSFAACGEGDEEEETSKRRKKDTETTSDTTEEIEETEEEEVEEDEKDEKKSPYTIFESLDETILDDGNISLTIGQFEEGKWGGIACQVEGENHTNQTMSVTLQAVAVNGMMTSDYFFLDMEAKDEGETEFSIYDTEDPGDLTRLSMFLRVTDEDYDSEYHLIEIYPQGKKAYKEDMPEKDGKDVLIDKKGVYVATQELVYREDWEPQQKYLAFNDSDEVVYLSLDPIAINGFGVTDFHSSYILPNTYVDRSVELYEYEDLLLLGMDDKITSLTLEVQLDDMDYETVLSDEITIYPEGKKNEKVFTYEPASDDVVVLETNDFRLLQVNYTVDDWNDHTVTFVIENKSGKTLCFSSDDTKINGKDVDFLFFYCDATGGRDTFTSCDLYDSNMKESNITKITSMEFTLEVWDEDYDDVYEGTVKFDVK